jgi:hypothetical protein
MPAPLICPKPGCGGRRFNLYWRPDRSYLVFTGAYKCENCGLVVEKKGKR